MSDPVVTLLSDFGNRDGFVGILKGVLLGICPSARTIDLSHEIAPQDVMEGALVLSAAVDHFPVGTVHLAIVDPGVGTDRRALLIETEAFTLVGPDNGLLSLAAARSPLRKIVHLDEPRWFAPSPSATFHGRDVFAPVAAHRANGVPPEQLGSIVEDYARVTIPAVRRVDDGIEGQILYVDRFGNLVCNIARSDLTASSGTQMTVRLGDVTIAQISATYGAVREGKPVAVWNSWDRLEIAVRNGSAVRQLRARSGDRVQLKARR